MFDDDLTNAKLIGTLLKTILIEVQISLKYSKR